MGLLAGALYDPATAVNQVCTSRLAQTSLHAGDAGFPQLTFTVPSNGSVLVRLRGVIHGATTAPQIFLGCLEGSTLRGRVTPVTGIKNTSRLATTMGTCEALYVYPGLTPGASVTWDAAYGVDVLAAATGLKYGGPNNTTTNDAFGGFAFEIYDTPNLLGACLYDPTGGARVAKACNALLAMTAIDTTNLRITFVAPSSGRVMVRLKGVTVGTSTVPSIVLGVLESTTVMGRAPTIGGCFDTTAVTTREPQEASFLVTGLVGGSTHVWDAAYGVEIVGAAGHGLMYGGPDDTTTDNAAGAFGFEIWSM